MTTFHARFVGGPRDGETFTHEGMAVIDLVAMLDEDTCQVHRYIAAGTDHHVYQHRGVVDQWSLADAQLVKRSSPY